MSSSTAYYQERRNEMAKLWNAGMSAPKLAEHFGMTIPAIHGVISRNRDLFIKKASVPVKVKPVERKFSVYWADDTPEHERKSLLDLKEGDCRYPYGEENFTFCGRTGGKTYCNYHAKLVYQVS